MHVYGHTPFRVPAEDDFLLARCGYEYRVEALRKGVNIEKVIGDACGMRNISDSYR